MQGILVDSVHKTFRGRRVKFLGLSMPLMREKSVRALNGISLHVSPGEAVGIIGPNGAGKTTLMGCLLGFIYPDDGKITIDGCDPNTMLVRSRIGYVPERLNFQFYLSMEELLSFHHELAHQPSSERKQKIADVLRVVKLDESKWKLPVGQCSRGMLQRLAIAQSLIANPRYLFLDEPTSGIDPGGVLELTGVLGEIKKQGITVVLNSHQLDQVERICDRMIFVQQGRAADAESMQESRERHSLILRFAIAVEGSSAEETLKNISEHIDIPLLKVWREFAEFAVADDDESRILLKAVINDELPLVEAAPEYNKLERMFMRSKDEARTST